MRARYEVCGDPGGMATVNIRNTSGVPNIDEKISTPHVSPRANCGVLVRPIVLAGAPIQPRNFTGRVEGARDTGGAHVASANAFLLAAGSPREDYGVCGPLACHVRPLLLNDALDRCLPTLPAHPTPHRGRGGQSGTYPLSFNGLGTFGIAGGRGRPSRWRPDRHFSASYRQRGAPRTDA